MTAVSQAQYECPVCSELSPIIDWLPAELHEHSEAMECPKCHEPVGYETRELVEVAR